jgi:ferredoxin
MEEAADLVVRYGGSLSGEHGDGQARGELLPKMFGPELMQAFREFKSLWDPDWKMNPGKLIDPLQARRKSPPRRRLRSLAAETTFKFPDDHGSLARHSALRGSRQMPPRFRRSHVPQLPRHARRRTLHPRPRPPALGDDARRRNQRWLDGWRSEEVKESLDLCLACKGCKSDCPVGVDVATYKAEFLSHYYEGRIAPAQRLCASATSTCGRAWHRTRPAWST